MGQQEKLQKEITKQLKKEINTWKIITMNDKPIKEEEKVYNLLAEMQRPFLDIMLEACVKGRSSTKKCLKCYPSAKPICRIKCIKRPEDKKKLMGKLHLDLTRYFNYSVGSARNYLLKKRDEEFDKIYSGHTIYVWSKSVKNWHSLQYKDKKDTSKERAADDKIRNKHLPRVSVWKEEPKDDEKSFPDTSVGDYIKKIKAGDIEPNANGYILVFSKRANMWHKLTVVHKNNPNYGKTMEVNSHNHDQNKNAKKKEITFGTDVKYGFSFEGNRITDIPSDSQAQAKKVKVGWRILSIDGEVQKDDSKNVKENLEKAWEETGKNVVIAFDTATS